MVEKNPAWFASLLPIHPIFPHFPTKEIGSRPCTNFSVSGYGAQM